MIYQVCLANIFSQSVACLLILLTCPFIEQIFNFSEGQRIISFMDGAFGVVSKKSQPYPRSSKLSLVLEVLYFHILPARLGSILNEFL